MLAVVEQTNTGYTATMKRDFKHSAEEVWAMLTVNDKLSRWFPELRAMELKQGGTMRFQMQDGTSMNMDIVDYAEGSLLEFTWDKDLVRFELYGREAGCHLIFVEKLDKITDHTPKDLAGWHVCLDVIGTLLDGGQLESREKEWRMWFQRYTQFFYSMQNEPGANSKSS
ncbi:SRPBCC family protein [Paenibacillus sp. HB172176]|uniref:SRPBCC family protein n=1 Tax=Paenibacillus sp. HB172176 TaxID=2493690 RepID=UPI00143CAE88|nr:SRPBCC family protein [Paenibacillus sp. HB172176]